MYNLYELTFVLVNHVDLYYNVKFSSLNDSLFSCFTCRWLSSKEIHKEDIKYWKREIPRLMCQMQIFLPSTFFNAQEHYLIHQVEEIELCGHMHSRSKTRRNNHSQVHKVLPWGKPFQGIKTLAMKIFLSMRWLSLYMSR